jgi:hypothetical protein
MKVHRPDDINFKYTKIINEDIQSFLFDKSITYYQFIYNPENFEIISIARGSILSNPGSKVCMLSMVHTNSIYRNKQFCKKNINFLVQNVNSIQSLNNFCLYVNKDKVSAIKCYEKCGFNIIKLHKSTHYLMELDIK